jgi:hypothetical protein
MAEQAAMRDEPRYIKGSVNGRDRWADSRAGGYAGRTELRQGSSRRPRPVGINTHTYIAVAFIRTLQNRVRFKKPIEKETHKSHFT